MKAYDILNERDNIATLKKLVYRQSREGDSEKFISNILKKIKQNEPENYERAKEIVDSTLKLKKKKKKNSSDISMDVEAAKKRLKRWIQKNEEKALELFSDGVKIYAEVV